MNEANQQQILQAAEEFVPVILEQLKEENRVHAETAIAAASRMAGTFLLRSFNLPIGNLDPGAMVLSEMANEQGPGLLNLLGNVLHQLGVSIDPKLISATPSNVDKPQLTINETQARIAPFLTEIKDRHGLTLEEAAQAAAITTGLIIKECAAVIDPNAAFSIAALGFVEGSKTVPVPLAE